MNNKFENFIKPGHLILKADGKIYRRNCGSSQERCQISHYKYLLAGPVICGLALTPSNQKPVTEEATGITRTMKVGEVRCGNDGTIFSAERSSLFNSSRLLQTS